MVRTTHAAYLIILYDSTARVRASHARPAPNPLAASHPRDRCASTAAPPTTHDARRADCVHAYLPHRIRVAHSFTSASPSPSQAVILGYGPSQQPRRPRMPHSHASSACFVWASASLDMFTSRVSSSSCVRAHSDVSSSVRTITAAGGQVGVIL
ncbi:hypothetical protein B0H17DRAFT_1201123 [Mycena rosella]|uniref:Uncharacterized protein n=1 Tax=Mycena rosella TaxID=1033263 RepID=A0AAD7DHN7_MYCRO|nr:hypothetical protein B0H17DRAFT_1201123 [Mycena rosella]